MTSLLGLNIDPGANQHACALDLDGELRQACFCPPEGFIAWPPAPQHIGALVIEKMVIYPKAPEGDPNDLIAVHGAARFAEGCMRVRGGPAAEWWEARAWKGQIKKWHHHSRIWSVLSAVERAVFARDAGYEVDAITRKLDEACERWARGKVTKGGKVTGYAWEAHNLFDAVGIMLKRLGRVGVAGHRFA